MMSARRGALAVVLDPFVSGSRPNKLASAVSSARSTRALWYALGTTIRSTP